MNLNNYESIIFCYKCYTFRVGIGMYSIHLDFILKMSHEKYRTFLVSGTFFRSSLYAVQNSEDRKRREG